jgi:glycosyltransferase involved in cell wall biosynthesis
MTPRSILFIGHSAGLTGAPLVLLNFLKWLKNNSDIRFNILLREGGALEADFRSLGPVTVLATGIRRLRGGRLERLGLRYFFDRMDARQLRHQFHVGEIGLIYSNTVTNGSALQALSILDCPVISHVHELEYWIQHYVGRASFDLVKQHSQQYIAVSEAVKRNLVENHGIAENQVEKVYEFINLAAAQAIDLRLAGVRVRHELNIPPQAFIVGASGTTTWWKGPDLFIELARLIHTQRSSLPVYFVWAGGSLRKTDFVKLQRKIAVLGLSQYVRFIGSRLDPLNYFAAFDVFALTSRSDSFPLVVLEAAALGKPIVCFDETGGAREFIGGDCGFVVPHLDVDAMAAAVLNLLDSPDLRARLSQNAQAKVQDYDVAVAAPKIWNVIERFYQP